jgi:3-hydroxybutyryl-CoA dehydratase
MMPDVASFPTVVDEVTQERIDAYAELSGDFNPLHVDPAAAAASEFGGIIAHGPIALHAFLRAATTWLGVDALPAGSEVKVTYRAPTRPGDRIAAELREAEDLGDGRTASQAECVNQDGTVVVSIRAVLVAPSA